MNRKITVVLIAAAAAGLCAALMLRFSGTSSFPAAGSGPAAVLLAKARAMEGAGNLAAAKAAYQQLVAEHPNHREVAQWQRRAEQLSIELLFSPVITPKSLQYEVKKGDALEKIAREHKTTVEMIRKANGIAGDAIFPGMKIKVWNGTFTILVDKSSNLLMLKSDEEIIKTYSVATGANNSTPAGTFKITEKLVNPPWYKDGKVIPSGSPENILGSRWMGLDREGYGIHGTVDPQSLGKQSTAGCVRMSNQEVEELFSIVPQGTAVVIVD